MCGEFLFGCFEFGFFFLGPYSSKCLIMCTDCQTSNGTVSSNTTALNGGVLIRVCHTKNVCL